MNHETIANLFRNLAAIAQRREDIHRGMLDMSEDEAHSAVLIPSEDMTRLAIEQILAYCDRIEDLLSEVP